MLAALALKAPLQQAPSPDRGMAADLNVVSTYLPYWNALFIDMKCADLLVAADHGLDLGHSAEIFTPASWEELLAWLGWPRMPFLRTTANLSSVSTGPLGSAPTDSSRQTRQPPRVEQQPAQGNVQGNERGRKQPFSDFC
jgi:hypothetical protein